MRVVLRNGFAHPSKAVITEDIDTVIERAEKRQLQLEHVSNIHYTRGQLCMQFDSAADKQLAARVTRWASLGERVLAVQMLPGDGRAWLKANGYIYSDYHISEEDRAANDA
jgi:hypothetical protein